MIDVWIPTVDQRWLILPRYTQPSPDSKLLIEKSRHPCLVAQNRAMKSRCKLSGRKLFVVETFQQPPLIPKHLTGPEAPN